MGHFPIFAALTFVVSTVLLYSEAAPVTEFFGSPQTIEGDSNASRNKVEEMERFHRTYKNGTVEFKMALSNGHVQYQRISSKTIDGDKVQVYEGYISERYKDGRYGTRYYAADENGYRSSAVIVENTPPILPRSGPYAVTAAEPTEEDDTSPPPAKDIESKTNTLVDELVKIEQVLEAEQLLNLNLVSKIGDKETLPVTKPEENQAPQVQQNDELLKTGELSPEETPSIVNESSTSSILRETTVVAGDSLNQEQPTNKISPDDENLIENSSVPLQTPVNDVSIENSVPHLEITTEQQLPSTSSESSSTSSEAITAAILNDDDDNTTEQEGSFNDAKNTGVPDILRIDSDTSSVTKYPLADDDSESTTLPSTDAVTKSSGKEDSTRSLLEEAISRDIENKLTLNINSENENSNDYATSINIAPENQNTETNDISTQNENQNETSTELPLTDLTTGADIEDQSIDKEAHDDYDSNKEGRSLDLDSSTELTLPLPESNNAKSIEKGSGSGSVDISSGTSEKKSSESVDEAAKTTEISTEQPKDEDNTTNVDSDSEKTTLALATDTEKNFENTTDDFTAVIESEEKSLENNEGKSIEKVSVTELPEKTIEEHNNPTETVEDNEVKSIHNSSLTELREGKSEDNIQTTETVKENEEKSIENASVTELPTENGEDNIQTTVTVENNEDTSTEYSSVTELPAGTIEDNIETTKLVEDNEDKSIEETSATEAPEERSEKNVQATEATDDITTEAEVLSTTEENNAKAGGVELEFYPPMFQF